MKFAPILAYALLPVFAMMGGLVMMFAGQLPPVMQAVAVGAGGLVLVVALGGLSLVMALEHASMQAVRVKTKQDERE